jgi:hypothetical protein
MTTDTTSGRRPFIPARERIVLAVGSALLVSGIVLVIAVLPAEYGVDPTGIGRWLGLTQMADIGSQVAAFEQTRAASGTSQATVVAQERPYQQEAIELKLGPREFVEYKYRLDKGEALLYSWKATAPVNVEFHAEPDGAPRGYAETYEKSSQVQSASGTLAAPFSGIHGWYWENTSGGEVSVTLSAAGFYSMSHEFRKDAAPKSKTYP